MMPELRAALRALAWNALEGRRSKQLTIEAAAWEAGLSSRHWAKIEAGEGNPTLAVLVKVSVALGVPIGDLFAPVQR